VSRRGFPHPHPIGWFQVAWSDDLPVGAVRPAKYFGQDLVMYRGQSGRPVVMDAYCLHMGAHLGWGGRVCDDDIVCPFHEWKWSAEGHNVEVPYSDSGPYRRRIRTWPVLEQNGLVLVWHDPNGEAPTWQPPLVEEFDSPDYYSVWPNGAERDRVRLYPQFVMENMVDYAHLGSVHQWRDAPPQIHEFEARGDSFYSHTSGVMATPKGPAQMEVFNEAWGVGLITSRIRGLRDTAFVSSVTPIDDEYSEVWCSTAVARPAGAVGDELDPFAKAMIVGQNEAILGNNPGDRDIWEHQRYMTHPSYVREEAPGFRALRNWAKKFYPDEPAPGAETTTE
jgi:3-ketosteroid 9alpha-monooxygenase subunit A